MTDLRNYSKRFVKEFIDMYRDLPCLWKVKDKDYSNRVLKNNAYEKLAGKLRQIEPEANKEMVVKKINSLRSAFRREFHKVKKCSSSGRPGVEFQYEPRLWYFNALLFTANQDTAEEPGLLACLRGLGEEDERRSDDHEDMDESEDTSIALKVIPD